MFRKFLNLINGKRSMTYIWDMFLFTRSDFTSKGDIEVPSNMVLQMHSPKIDGALIVNGEVYIL